MTFRRTLLLGALAFCSLLVAGARVDAAYTYTTSDVMFSAPPAGLVDAFAPNSNSVAGDNPVNRALITVSFGTLPGSQVSGSQTLSFTETIAPTSGAATVYNVTGTFAFTASPDGVSGTFTNVVTTLATGSPMGFTLASTGYSNNNGTTPPSGDFGFNITPTAAIPEPTSVVIMGMGLVGVVGLGLRRSRTKAKA